MKKFLPLFIIIASMILSSCGRANDFTSETENDSTSSEVTESETTSSESEPTTPSEPDSESETTPSESEPTTPSEPDSETPSEEDSEEDSESEPESGNYTGYYSSISKSATGGTFGTLRTSLTKLIKPKAYYTYSGTGVGDLGYELQYYDEDPNNSNNMIMFYTQHSIKKQKAGTWNREHVWPQSKSDDLYGKSRGGADLLHIRPTYQSTNSKRGNLIYANVSGDNWVTYNGIKYCKTSGGCFEPIDSVKGDCARITLYMWVCYFAERGTSITNNCDSVQTMLDWCELDPPSEQEIMRNNRVEQSKQGNRNPFVDHPEWAEKIFG